MQQTPATQFLVIARGAPWPGGFKVHCETRAAAEAEAERLLARPHIDSVDIWEMTHVFHKEREA